MSEPNNTPAPNESGASSNAQQRRKRREEHDSLTYVRSEEMRLAIERIPSEFRTRLRDIIPWGDTRGMRQLGWVTTRGRRDIVICSSLPVRVSLRTFIAPGQSATEFGAPARGQWPPWAVRRFILYDVLLHELGHLQLVDPKGRSWRRKFAAETKANEFANTWRRTLWAERFDHCDVVHNAPSSDEMEFIGVWEQLDKAARYRLLIHVLEAPHVECPDLDFLGELTEAQERFVQLALLGRASPVAD